MKTTIKNLLPSSLFIYLQYFKVRKEILNLKNPKTFSEKIQWIKLYGNLEKYAPFVDKYEVREFVQKTIGREYLIPLLGVWGGWEEIPIFNLPGKFILKATHGSGWVAICHDKKQIDFSILKSLVDSWISRSFYAENREPQYKHIAHRVIGEKYLGEAVDYKFHCTDGEVRTIEVHTNRFSYHKIYFMDTKWKMLRVTVEGYARETHIIPKPENIEKMIAIAASLSSFFPYVRVDLYNISGKIYFGELTFTPGNGTQKFSADRRFGELIDITRYKYDN